MNNNLEPINNLETTSCPLCNTKDCKTVYDFSPYSVVRCQSCNLYYLSPRLTESAMMEFYRQGDYFEGENIGYDNYSKQNLSLHLTFHRFMSNLKERNMTGGSLLEVGCGYGYLLEEAKDLFSIRIGTEYSSRAIEHAKTRANHIYEGGIEQVPLNDKFDCIVAIQVIEHVYKPKYFLEQMVNHLKPGGKIVIATPDMGGLLKKFTGSHWPSFKLPEHILYFDKKTLYDLMRHAKLMNVDMLPYPHAFPLSLIAGKLNISLPQILGKYVIWIPATTIAVYGYYNCE